MAALLLTRAPLCVATCPLPVSSLPPLCTPQRVTMRPTDDREIPPVWRSILFVPASSERFIASAPRQPADALQIDLEDSVRPEDKERARAAVIPAARQFRAHRKDVIVRVNRAWRWLVRDLESSVCAEVGTVTLPKVPDAGFVRSVAEVLADLEVERGLPSGHTRLLAMVEDVEGLHQIDAIAVAHERLLGITIGSEDLALSLRTALDGEALLHAHLQLLKAARRADIMAFGFVGSVADYTDLDRFRAQIIHARALGFEGAFCIHPAQLAILNEGFSPTAAEYAAALELRAASGQARDDGRGAFAYKGRMVDRPIIERALRTIEGFERLRAT